MLFRQLLEPISCTYSYLIACPATKICAIVDPVIETLERDLQLVQSLGLTLAYTVETHIHADHLTGAFALKQVTGSQICSPAMDQLPCTDRGLYEGAPLPIGFINLWPLFTPGHTATHHCYWIDNGTHTLLFSGDTLLIDACGRTDFQGGDAATLYHSIQDKLFSLPDETLVYPGHDYEDRFVSTIAQEKSRNPRLKKGQSREAFVAMMDALKQPYPRKMERAIPGNRRCGQWMPDE